MKDLRDVIAKNICDLRTEMKMTQLQLAEVLNYSDKAVSKWERGEAIPDVTVLKRIADHFGVTVDYLLESDHGDAFHPARKLARMRRRNRAMISIMAVSGVWLVATIVFAVLVSVDCAFIPWMPYVYAIPASAVVAIVFNSLWGPRKVNFLIVTVMIWGVICSVYLSLLLLCHLNLWVLFIVGIPLQFIAIFLPGLGLFRYKADRGAK